MGIVIRPPEPKNYFSDAELSCTHCGKNGFSAEALALFNSIRESHGQPMIVTSAYRCEDHPIEREKIESGKPAGSHSRGTALDIKWTTDARMLDILRIALNAGCVRVGMADRHFMHLDFDTELTEPSYWQY